MTVVIKKIMIAVMTMTMIMIMIMIMTGLTGFMIRKIMEDQLYYGYVKWKVRTNL